MKIIKFHKDLVPLVLSGCKTVTWRLFDDKDLSLYDKCEFREFGSNTQFATATITEVVEKEFSQLSNEDRLGHESYSSDEEMYDTYSRYYSTIVDSGTKLKIIHFKLSESS